MDGLQHVYEALGFSFDGECSGHIWKGKGRCPYCEHQELSRKRSQEIADKALEILEAELAKKEAI